MNPTQIDIGRRRWLARGSALCIAGGASFQGLAAAPADARFAALKRPAFVVQQPARAVLLAAATAGARVVAVGERGIVALSDDGGTHWRQARDVPTSATLTGVQFVDGSHGWAIGHGGVILATADGGESWRLQADGRVLAERARTASDARGAAGDARAPALSKEAALLVADGPDKPLLDLHFTDAKHGVVVGAYNLFFETRDGGATWDAALDRLDNAKAQHLYAVRSRGDTWLVAGEQGLLLRSRDGGKAFERLTSPYAGSWFALAVTAKGEWILAGLRGHVFRSTDDGDHWAAVAGAPPASFVCATALADGGVVLANQAGQVFSCKGAEGLVAWPTPNLPPLSQVVPLAGGDLLAVGLGGAFRLSGKST